MATDTCLHKKNLVLCNHNSKKLHFIKAGFPIYECRECGHSFAVVNDLKDHVSKVYSDSYFFEGKDGYPDYLEEKKILLSAGRRYARKISRLTKPGKMLDVGSAAGFLMYGFHEVGWQCQGIEPNNTMASHGRDHMGLNIMTGSFEQFQSDDKYDLITLIQVLGHFYDLNKAVINISKHLKENGLVLIESWNRRSIFARVLGKNWPEYSPPSVLHYFSETTLVQLMNSIGLQLVSKGYPIKRINLKHAASLLEGKLPDFILKKRIFSFLSRMAGNLPLIYPFLDLKWYVFRKVTNTNIDLD